jgi:hypothetical protein
MSQPSDSISLTASLFTEAIGIPVYPYKPGNLSVGECQAAGVIRARHALRTTAWARDGKQWQRLRRPRTSQPRAGTADGPTNSADSRHPEKQRYDAARERRDSRRAAASGHIAHAHGSQSLMIQTLTYGSGSFSVGRLLEFLAALRQDVQITVRPSAATGSRGKQINGESLAMDRFAVRAQWHRRARHVPAGKMQDGIEGTREIMIL